MLKSYKTNFKMRKLGEIDFKFNFLNKIFIKK